jgi:hypothetical protein
VHEIMSGQPCSSTASLERPDALFRYSLTGDDGLGCSIHDVVQMLPGVQMSAIKVALRVLLHGDWIFDALGAGEGQDATLSAAARWMYVLIFVLLRCALARNSCFFMCFLCVVCGGFCM